ncbi:MAG TPA: DUF1684 domain-containing protein [Candidatus Limnocylindrales bacterium]|nr:DUF1684 domain-containing protein [Candidatus Limnocylindrales bacterium]
MTLEHDHSAHDHSAHEHADEHEHTDEHERVDEHEHGNEEHDDHEGHGHGGHDHSGHDHDHSGHEHVAYPDAVASFRAEKDEYFKDAHDSPIPVAEREAFVGLPYFAVDESLRFEGLTLEPYTGSEPTHFQIPTSDGKLRDAKRAGVFQFDIGGTTHRLTGYTFAKGPAESVFVPFQDGTTGQESYGAGRYIDVYPEEDGTYALDFNLAYHPSCVYDARFSCPLTPAENRLPIRIEAGERLAADH